MPCASLLEQAYRAQHRHDRRKQKFASSWSSMTSDQVGRPPSGAGPPPPYRVRLPLHGRSRASRKDLPAYAARSPSHASVHKHKHRALGRGVERLGAARPRPALAAAYALNAAPCTRRSCP